MQDSESKKTDQVVTVNVGVSVAKPGDVVDLPLTLSAPELTRVGRLESEISFPKRMLSFMKAEQGLAAELSDAQVEAKVKDENDSDLSIIVITISASHPIRPGILAYLKFRVSEEAAKGFIVLGMKSQKAASDAKELLQTAKGKDGEITVFGKDEEIPLVGCFFFTH